MSTVNDIFPGKPYSCGHMPEGICDGCLEARIAPRFFAVPGTGEVLEITDSRWVAELDLTGYVECSTADEAGRIADPANFGPGRAFADSYVARVYADGDELRIPFELRVDRDYSRGEYLYNVAYRTAQSLMRDPYEVAGSECRVDLYDAATAVSCADDAEPERIATATAHAW